MTDLMAGMDTLIEKAQNDLSILEEAKKRMLGGSVTKAPARPTAKKPKSTGTKRKRRGGTRAEKTLKLIEENPGITGKQLAEAMKMKPNYLYRVLGELEKESKVKKDGRKYEAVPA
jgi:predicted HTH transcriptional regulator